MVRSLALAAAFFLGSACAPVAAPGGPRQADCPILASSDWTAWVNAMPGPGARPTLIVTGNVTVPTGGYATRMGPGPTLRSEPPIQHVLLDVTPPSGAATQAVMTLQARGEFPALPSYGRITVVCGNRILAEIAPVERAF
jgi:hypothetical protein